MHTIFLTIALLAPNDQPKPEVLPAPAVQEYRQTKPAPTPAAAPQTCQDGSCAVAASGTVVRERHVLRVRGRLFGRFRGRCANCG
jgi:hypothetical protein